MDIKITDFGSLGSKIKEQFRKNKIAVILLTFGLLILVFTKNGKASTEKTESTNHVQAPYFSLEEEEKKISEALAGIDGAGRVKIVLTLKSGVSQQLAENARGSSRSDEESTDSDIDTTVVTVSNGSGVQTIVPVKYLYPEYQGALVICDGAGSPEVKLRITQAVCSLTGLRADKISVVKMKTGG